MGPIHDGHGVEYGGIISCGQFQLITERKLRVFNSKGLGVPVGDISIATLGLDDDKLLLATTVPHIQTLTNTADHLSTGINMMFMASKTKILVTNP